MSQLIIPGLKSGDLVLAPLAGVTDSAMRYLCRREGAALSFTEMVSAKGLYYGSSGTEELLAIREGEGPVGIQLFGSDPEMIAFACEKLADRPNLIIDINMGCPVPKVVKNNEGSALLRSPQLACRIVEAAVKKAKKPVTVKMRIGIDPAPDTEPESRIYDYVSFARGLENAGASAVSVHGRTREQYYSGKADWQAIKAIKSALSIPVIGNGDVRSFDDARRMCLETGCDLVMIGRAAMGNPWIFRGLTEADKGTDRLPAEEIRRVLGEHFEMLLSNRGTRRACMEMRKHFAWYTKGLRGASELRKRVNTAETPEEIRSLIAEI